MKLVQWIFLAALLLVVLPLGHALYMTDIFAQQLRKQDLASIDRRLNSTLQNVQERIGHVQSVLATLAKSEAAMQGDWQSLYDYARRVVENEATLKVITLIDAETRIVFGTVVPYGAEHPSAAQPEDVRRVLATGQPVLSSPFQTPFSGMKPVWLVAIGVPIVQHGKVTHVLRGIIRCDSLQKLLVDLQFPEGWLATITDRQGILIARTLSHEETVGKSVNPPMAEAIHERREDVFSLTNREGVVVVAKIGFLPGEQWSVQVGIEESLLMAESRQAVRRIVLFYVVMILLVFGLAWWIARHFNRSITAIVAFAGDVVQHRPFSRVSSRIRELDQLQDDLESVAAEQSALLADAQQSAERMKNVNAELEQRVIERTDALKRSHARVDTERERFLKILDTMPVMIDIIRADHSIEWGNRAYREAFGNTVGGTCYASQFGRDAPCLECQAFVPLQTGLPHHWEWALPNGRTFDIYNFPFVASDGTPAVLEMDIDVTEQRQASAALESMKESLEVQVRDRTADLREAAEQASAAANLLSLATSSAELGIWSWRVADEYLNWTDICCRHFGVTAGASVPLVQFLDILHPADRAGVEAAMARSVENLSDFREEYRVVWPDGSIHWLRALGRAHAGTDGKFEHMEGVTQEITQSKELALTLARTEEQLRLATEGANIGTWYWPLPGEDFEWSNQHKLIFGLSPGDVPSFNYFRSVLHPEDAERVEREGQAALADQGKFSSEFRIVLPDGRLRWIQSSGKVFVDAHGIASGMGGVVMDITERKQAEQALVRTRDTLSQAQLIAHLGSFEYDAATQHTTWSDEEYRIYGLDPAGPSPAYGDMLARCIHPEDAALLDQTFTRAMREKTEYELEHRIVRPDGSVRWVHDLARPYFDTQGKLLRYIGATLDITERKLIQMQLEDAKAQAEAANRAKSEFLANMSHEIRTPLNGIMGLATIIRNQGLTPRQTDLMGKLQVSSQHLLDLLADILDLARIEAGKLVIGAESFDANQLADNLRSIMQADIERKGLQLHVDVEPLPGNLRGDRVRIRQAYLNLLGNAVKFTEQGSIALHVTKAAEDASSVLVRFEVEDSGIGVSADILPRLFADFEQADNSSTRKYGGSGLGLALVKRLAVLMGGEAGASSTPGVGSRFWFTARLNKPANGDAAPAAPTDDALQMLQTGYAGRSVLLADDEPVNRMIAEMMLADAGLIVDQAEDGEQAVRMAGERRYDLILMDMQMPRLGGVAATREIRGRLGLQMPIIAVTANVFEQDRQECLAAGMNDFLAKPFDTATFYATLLRWLDNPLAADTQSTPERG